MKSRRQQAYEEYLQYSQQKKTSHEEFLYNDQQANHYEDEFDEADYYETSLDRNEEFSDRGKPVGQRAKYSAKLDRFLNNGIIITGVLLLVVLAIAFLI